MASYEELIQQLLWPLLAMLLLFAIAFTGGFVQLSFAALVCALVIAGVIVVLARFGGDLGRTN